MSIFEWIVLGVLGFVMLFMFCATIGAFFQEIIELKKKMEDNKP